MRDRDADLVGVDAFDLRTQLRDPPAGGIGVRHHVVHVHPRVGEHGTTRIEHGEHLTGSTRDGLRQARRQQTIRHRLGLPELERPRVQAALTRGIRTVRAHVEHALADLRGDLLDRGVDRRHGLHAALHGSGLLLARDRERLVRRVPLLRVGVVRVVAERGRRGEDHDLDHVERPDVPDLGARLPEVLQADVGDARDAHEAHREQRGRPGDIPPADPRKLLPSLSVHFATTQVQGVRDALELDAGELAEHVERDQDPQCEQVQVIRPDDAGDDRRVGEAEDLHRSRDESQLAAEQGPASDPGLDGRGPGGLGKPLLALLLAEDEHVALGRLEGVDGGLGGRLLGRQPRERHLDRLGDGGEGVAQAVADEVDSRLVRAVGQVRAVGVDVVAPDARIAEARSAVFVATCLNVDVVVVRDVGADLADREGVAGLAGDR